jgi:hypothetical protein
MIYKYFKRKKTTDLGLGLARHHTDPKNLVNFREYRGRNLPRGGSFPVIIEGKGISPSVHWEISLPRDFHLYALGNLP